MHDLVTAVMITGLPGRKKLAMAALAAYRQQTYLHRELIIVDPSPEPLIPRDTPDIKIVRPEPSLSLGELRNIGLGLAQGDWIIQHDDDDWHHHDRFRYQMANSVPSQACLLRCQVRCDLTDRRMVVWKWPGVKTGIPGTILHPNEQSLRYRDEARGEDTNFINDHFGGRTVVAENVCFPHCYVRFYHGTNTWSRSHVMGTTGLPRPRSTEADYVQQIVDLHYQDALTESLALVR